MAYNNGFPMNYSQYYPQYPQMNTPMNQPMSPTQMSGTPQLQGTQMSLANQQSSIIWVQGEAGAKSFLVAPNTTVQLWDSENQVIYLKSADSSGMPSMKVLDYTIRDSEKPAAQTMDNYVTREELASLEERIKNQLSRMNGRKTERRGNDNE